MDTEKCRAFLAVLEAGNLSTAAERLGYTPSGMSRLIDAMERESGLTLLRRGRGGVELTRSGEELLPCIRRMAEEGQRYEQTVQALRGLAVGRAHPLAEEGAFPVERLATEPFIDILPGQETDNSRMTAASLPRDVVARPLEPPQPVHLGLALNREPSPAAKYFIEYALLQLSSLRELLPFAAE